MREYSDMSEDESQKSEKLKSKDLVWLLKEDRTPSNSSALASKKSGRITPEKHQNWKVLERGKSEVQNPKDMERKKESDAKLKRTTSFPVKSCDSKSSSKGRLELQNPIQENEEGEFSPVLYRSKSSLWSVSTESSEVTAQQRRGNEESDMSCSNSKENPVPARSDVVRSLQSPLGTIVADRRNNRELSMNESQHLTSQPPKPQRAVHKMRSNESVSTQPKRTKGLLMSVQEFKSKSNRDPEFANDDLKVNFQDIILEPSGYRTPRFSWSLSKEIYEFSKGCCYTAVSLFCAIPFALFWGIWFSILACLNVWCLAPFKRSHFISIAHWRAIWSVFVSCFCDPVYQSAGMVLSNISIRTENHVV